MAGIGFRLDKIMRSGRLGPASAAFGYGVVLAAGQWLIAVIGIAAISVVAAGRLDQALIVDFRVVVVFAVMLAMIAVAPVVLSATRLVSDALFDERPQEVPSVLIGAIVIASVLALVLGAVVLFGVMRLEVWFGASALLLVTLFAQLWVIAGFAGAVQQVGWVTAAYVLGGIMSIIGAVWAGFAGNSALHMVLGYSLGLGLTVGLLLLRVLMAFPFPMPELGRSLTAALAAMRLFWPLSTGALAVALGLWVDKWIVWGSALGLRAPSGLVHSPAYDAAVFFGLLSMIPGLALLVIQLETRFYAEFRGFITGILAHAPLHEIEAAAERFCGSTLSRLHRVLGLQAAISLALIALCPALARADVLRYQQVPVMTLVILGAWFLYLSIVTSTLLLHLDMRGRFAAVQFSFLFGVSAASIFWQPLDARFLGVGFAAGCVLSGTLGYALLARTLERLTYHLMQASALRATCTRPRRQMS